MLHIILLILKIVGIILLCILGILLLAVGCLLFVPLRYRIDVRREEGEGKPPVIVRARITWLLHLINVHIGYPADVYVRARVFLFTLFRIPKSESKKGNSRRKKKKDSGKKDKEIKNNDQKDNNQKEDASPGQSQNGKHEENSFETDKESEGADKTENCSKESIETTINPDQKKQEILTGPETIADQTEQPSGFIGKIVRKIHIFLDKIRQLIEKIKAVFKKTQYTILHLYDKIKSISDNIQYYREVIESEPFIQSWALCQRQAGIILKELRPDKLKADLIIGTDDPATTGEILAVCGMLYPLFGQNVRVVGDFERAHIEGWINIQGKMRVFTFLRVAVKVYFSKDFRTLIRLFKKKEAV